jgi:hypothetical protein
MTNPALRQTAILQIMAKRFPAAWGQEPQNTLDHFLARDDHEKQKVVSSGLCANCEQISQMSAQDLQEELATLRKRHHIDP